MAQLLIRDIPEALVLALEVYLALAKRLGTYVVTADTRFGQAVADHGTHVGRIRVLSPMVHGPGP